MDTLPSGDPPASEYDENRYLWIHFHLTLHIYKPPGNARGLYQPQPTCLADSEHSTMFTRTLSLFVLAALVTFVQGAPQPESPDVTVTPSNGTEFSGDAITPEFTGQATFFEPGLGACGFHNTAKDSIVAVSSKSYKSSNCRRKIKITYRGKTEFATIADECPTCPGKYDLDLSPAVFNKFAKPSVGVLKGIQWNFV